VKRYKSEDEPKPKPGPEPQEVFVSSKTQAVIDAAFDADFEIDFANLDATFEASIKKIAAAAIRTAANQAVPRETVKDPNWVSGAYKQRMDTRAHLLSIADELEGL
jgi:hypothetical protein